MDFSFEVPMTVFEKSDASDGKTRRIAGIISTEKVDQQGEVILAEGLDFSAFLKGGWYNDNHSKKMTDILGYPEEVRVFRDGEILPNGDVAKSNGVWAEGYLLNTPKADEVWNLANALSKTNRRLGFSVEGSVLRREGPDKKRVVKAKVVNCAITHCPVNDDSRLDVLVKSLIAANAADDEIDKALTMGPPTPGGVPTGGAVLAQESLESDVDYPERKKKLKNQKKVALTKAEAVSWVQSRIPGISEAQALRIINITEALKGQGKI